MRKVNTVLFITVLFFAVYLCAYPATIELKNGKVITGKVLRVGDNYIQIDFYGIPVTYYFDSISTIDGNPPRSGPGDDKFIPSAGDDSESLAVKYGLSGNFEKCRQFLEKALTEGSDEFAVKRSLNIIKDLERGLINQKGAIHLFKARFYIGRNQLKQALSEYQQALQRNPDYIPLYGGIAEIYLFTENLELALRYFELAAQKNPVNPDYYAHLGVLYRHFARLAEARRSFQKARELFLQQGSIQDAALIENFLKELE